MVTWASNWICSPGPSGELTPREHPCPASQVPPSADTAGQTTSEVCNLFVWSPRTCQRGINEVLLLLEDWWGRGDGALWIAISVASRKIYFLKKTCDSPRAKGIEPFKQIQIHLKSVQTRKHSQGLWEDGYGQGVMTHRTQWTTWMEQLGHRKICESLCTRDLILPETEMYIPSL